MSKVVRIKVQDDGGQPLGGQRVNVSGCTELESSPDGLTQFLIGDDPSVSITIEGKEAWSGAPADLAAVETFVRAKGGFKRA